MRQTGFQPAGGKFTSITTDECCVSLCVIIESSKLVGCFSFVLNASCDEMELVVFDHVSISTEPFDDNIKANMEGIQK